MNHSITIPGVGVPSTCRIGDYVRLNLEFGEQFVPITGTVQAVRLNSFGDVEAEVSVPFKCFVLAHEECGW